MSVTKWEKLVGKLVTVECIDSMADNQRTSVPPSEATLFERKVHGLLLHVDSYRVVVGYETPVGNDDTDYDYTTIWTDAVRTIQPEGKTKKRK